VAGILKLKSKFPLSLSRKSIERYSFFDQTKKMWIKVHRTIKEGLNLLYRKRTKKKKNLTWGRMRTGRLGRRSCAACPSAMGTSSIGSPKGITSFGGLATSGRS
jgi:hypothetical protein